MTKASDNAFPSILITEGTEPSAPAAGKQRMYIDSTTHVLMLTNSSGTESAVGGVLGAWTAYTPTWTTASGSPNLGSSTITGRYKLLDSKTVIVIINMVITTGGAWNAGSGNWKFSLPSGMTTPSSQIQLANCHVLDSGTTHYSGTAKIPGSSTQFDENIIADSSGSKIMTNTLPVTWATGDQVNIQGIIEIA